MCSTGMQIGCMFPRGGEGFSFICVRSAGKVDDVKRDRKYRVDVLDVQADIAGMASRFDQRHKLLVLGTYLH
jgi:hypothetical protein